LSLERTAEGLSSLYLFHRVQAVVFVEGGKSYTLEDVASGSCGTESDDVVYWRHMFDLFAPNLTVAVLPIGSKTTLLAIAGQIASGEVTHVCVALDRDHDNRHGGLIDGAGVLYTFGYSWENDVCAQEVLAEVIWTLSRGSITRGVIGTSVSQSLAVYLNAIRRIVLADVLLATHDVAILPRDKPNSILVIQNGKPPALDVHRILGILRNARRQVPRPLRVGQSAPVVVQHDCCGHVLGAFCYHLTVHIVRANSNMGVSKQVFWAVAIDKLVSSLAAGSLSHLAAHYQLQFSRLTLSQSRP
jgi:hypothetical protein